MKTIHSRIITAAVSIFVLLITTTQNRAAFLLTLQQVGNNVVATGSGTLNLYALNLAASGPGSGTIEPSDSLLCGGTGEADYYFTVTGPSDFGSGSSQINASSNSGNIVGIDGENLVVPAGYTSGLMTDTSTWDNATFSSLGITTGTYTWTWGNTFSADSLTVQTVAAVVPEPSSAALAMLCVPVLFGFRKFRNIALM